MFSPKIQTIVDYKSQGRKITMLTAYDYPMGHLLEEVGIDIALVGDSLANVVLGLESTTEVGMAEMLHHAKAVRRGVKNALLVGDMPYEAYQEHTEDAVANAKRFVDEAGCDAIKLEWFEECIDVARQIVDAGVPVMGHVGLTPQTAQKFSVQGKDAESAQHIFDQAKELENAGCFSIVLECIPKEIAQKISEVLNIPTIGIGAGVHCDGQVLVTHDALGFFDRFQPKFAKQYAQLNQSGLQALQQFRDDVLNQDFPDDDHSFTMKPEEVEKLNLNS